MNTLVYLPTGSVEDIPFTTSDIIAEYARVSHHAVQQMIGKYEAQFKAFGLLAFEMRAVKKARGIKHEKLYHLNEQQATLLITFLRNTEPVLRFKTELVRQFYVMRAELQRRQINREQLKPIRRELTDVIRDKPDSSKWDYKLFTDLAYKSVLGRNAAQIRKDRNAPKNAVAMDYMTAEEISAVTKAQSQISVLLEMGMGYDQIKALLLSRKMLGNVA